MRGFSTSSHRLGIDLGSSTIRIYADDKMLLSEDSCAVVSDAEHLVLGYGTEALVRYHSMPEKSHLVYPIVKGMMTDYRLTCDMLRFFIEKSLHGSVSRPEVMVAIRSDMSVVTRHALVDALVHAGCQRVFLISATAAAAVGIGAAIHLPDAVLSMVVGKDVTDCGLFCGGGFVYQEGLNFGGATIDLNVRDYVRDIHGVIIGKNQAEVIKKELSDLGQTGETDVVPICGRRLADGVEVALALSRSEIYSALQKILRPSAQLLRKVMQRATPEMAEDLLHNGILLSGGSARLPGFSDWIHRGTRLPVTVPDMPEEVVARGCFLALVDYKRLPLLVESGARYYKGA
ncbi:MAG: rod shape-determining protein [Dialister sp.]|nr:rod shape-determining protein [Dialister sp.]